jgi:hypothetical protein
MPRGRILLTFVIGFVAGLSIGFVGGYGVRELISRRRRAAEREKWFKRQHRKKQKRWTLEELKLENRALHDAAP